MIYFMRSAAMRKRGPSGRTMAELYELQLDEMKRKVDRLTEKDKSGND